MNLTRHFTLEELIASGEAARKGIDNTPNQSVIDNLKRVANMMEDIRTLLGGKPIFITSGYRCSALNKLIGSKPTSRHVEGLAVDFKCPEYGTPYDIVNAIAQSNINFDQCIMEYNSWCHIGLGNGMRRQILTINQHGTYAGIHV